MPIYGSRLLDTLACVRDVVVGTADGVLRIMGDRHYATDVLTGAVIGFGVGFGVPTVLHYGNTGYAGALDTLSVSPMMGNGRAGLFASGRF